MQFHDIEGLEKFRNVIMPPQVEDKMNDIVLSSLKPVTELHSHVSEYRVAVVEVR
jgi:hypothetical protein